MEFTNDELGVLTRAASQALELLEWGQLHFIGYDEHGVNSATTHLRNAVAKLVAEKERRVSPFSSIPAYGDVMTVERFAEDVESGAFTDYDGHGYYAIDGQMATGTVVHPSTFSLKLAQLSGWTHIVWFNR